MVNINKFGRRIKGGKSKNEKGEIEIEVKVK